MSGTVTSTERRCTHDAVFYGSADEYLATVVPFIHAAMAADEPTLLAVYPDHEKLIRSAVRDITEVSFLGGVAEYEQPTSVIRALRSEGLAHFSRGAQRVHVVSEAAQPVDRRPWEWWARYEAAFNIAFADTPLRALCPYDTRITPSDMLDDVRYTHPSLSGAEATCHANPDYRDPARFIAARRPADGADPLEADAPAAQLSDPSAGDARHAVRNAAAATSLDEEEADEYASAVSEAVTNAWRHGRAPVCLNLWRGPDKLVTTVTDRGPGPADPLAGLMPPTSRSSGAVGLWLLHQMCSHVTLGRDGHGFTIRLVAGH